MLHGAMASISETESREEAVAPQLATLLVQQWGGASEDFGRRVLVEDRLLLGRNNPLFASRYAGLSRAHAEVVEQAGRLRVTDLGSRHGTMVRGKKVKRGLLVPGELLEAGGIGFLVVRAPPLFVPSGKVAHASYSFGVALGAVEAAKRLRAPLVISGEAGSGKSLLASLLPERELIDHLEELTPERQQALLRRVREVEVDASVPPLLLLCTEPPQELLRRGTLLPALAPLLSWVVTAAPLRDRPEDVLPIALRHLHARQPGIEWKVSAALAQRLVAASWPGNVRELLTEVERLAHAATGGELIDTPAPPRASWQPGAICRVAADASWFEPPGGARVELRTRRVLRAVLESLLQARRSPRGRVSSREIVQHTWPGEKLLPRAAANRVYVALNELRALGFGPAIESSRDGYRFTEGAIEIVAL